MWKRWNCRVAKKTRHLNCLDKQIETEGVAGTVPQSFVLCLWIKLVSWDLVFSNLLEAFSFQVESVVNQAQEVGSNIFDTVSGVIGPVIEFVKPGIDAALPLVKQAGEEVLKNASPVISDATKKAQEAMQSAGMDSEPVMTAAKVWL